MTIYITPQIIFHSILYILVVVAIIYLIIVLRNLNENLKATKRILDKTEITLNDVSDKVYDTMDIFNEAKENVLLYLGIVGEVFRALLGYWKKKDL